MRTKTGVAVALCAAVVLAGVAALARGGDGRSVEERLAALESQNAERRGREALLDRRNALEDRGTASRLG